MPDGGTLSLALEYVHISHDSRRDIREIEPGHWIKISVTDSGAGIPAANLPHLFEPFFTTKTKGTGLGLPVARRIIEEHKGTIEIDSHETKGTRFIIKLPLETGITL